MLFFLGDMGRFRAASVTEAGVEAADFIQAALRSLAASAQTLLATKLRVIQVLAILSLFHSNYVTPSQSSLYSVQANNQLEERNADFQLLMGMPDATLSRLYPVYVRW